LWAVERIAVTRHRGAVHAGREAVVEVDALVASAEGAAGEVARLDRTALRILHLLGAVALAGRAVAAVAARVGVELLSRGDRLRGRGRRCVRLGDRRRLGLVEKVRESEH